MSSCFRWEDLIAIKRNYQNINGVQFSLFKNAKLPATLYSLPQEIPNEQRLNFGLAFN